MLIFCALILFLISSYDILTGGYVGYSSILSYFELLLSSGALIILAYELTPASFDWPW